MCGGGSIGGLPNGNYVGTTAYLDNPDYVRINGKQITKEMKQYGKHRAGDRLVFNWMPVDAMTRIANAQAEGKFDADSNKVASKEVMPTKSESLGGVVSRGSKPRTGKGGGSKSTMLAGGSQEASLGKKTLLGA